LIEKKRRIASRRVKRNGEEWIEFDVGNCVNYWRTHANKNYGLEIEIEDPWGTKLNPNEILIQMNCSGMFDLINQTMMYQSDMIECLVTFTDTLSSPLPNLSNLLPASKIPSRSFFFNQRYPTLDLLTVEVAKSENSRSTN